MRKALALMALGAAAASTSVQANDNWYVAADILNTDLEMEGLDFGSETGLGIAVGKQFQYSDTFKLALEVEYVHFGSFSLDRNFGYGSYMNQEIEASAFNFNAKPKLHFSGSGFYVGALAGVGVTGVDIEQKSNMYGYGDVKTDGSDVSFNYGVEAGYEFTSGVVVSGGYRASSVAIDVEGGGEFDFDFDSFFVGVEYHFGS